MENSKYKNLSRDISMHDSNIRNSFICVYIFCVEDFFFLSSIFNCFIMCVRC